MSRKMRSLLIRATFGFLLLTIGAVSLACGSGGGDGDPTLVIKATDQLKFQPARLTVKAGERVKIRLDNSKSMVIHDLTIDEIPASDVQARNAAAHGHEAALAASATKASVHVAADAGRTAFVEFIADRPGTYAFYCSVTGHRQGGMEGIIIVDPA